MWSARTPRSQDAALAVGVLRTILNRVETPPPGTAPSSTSPAANTAAANTVASTGISAEEPEGENHGQETAPSDPSDRATTATGGAPPTPDVTAGLQAQAVFEASLGEDYTARVDYDVMPQLDSFFSSTEGLDWVSPSLSTLHSLYSPTIFLFSPIISAVGGTPANMYFFFYTALL